MRVLRSHVTYRSTARHDNEGQHYKSSNYDAQRLSSAAEQSGG